MGIVMDPRPVKLIASMIFKEERFLHEAEEKLEENFGPFGSLQKTLPFDFTEYYCGEMGKPLKRKLLCFKKLVDLEGMADIKLMTNEMEEEMATDGKRAVNIDPGYITEAKLVLLTTKDYTHRIHIGRKIYAETTLHYREGSFRPWPWTYPDYSSEEMISFFDDVRSIYMEETRSMHAD